MPGERILAPRRAEVGERGEREERLRGEIVQGKPQRWGAQPAGERWQGCAVGGWHECSATVRVSRKGER